MTATSLFLVLEGPEGAGKSVQASRLAEWFRQHGAIVTLTREPGGTPTGEAIRAILLQSDHLHLEPETEALLMTAARAQHVREVIEPALERGEVVISDRFVDSTYAYQGGGRGLPMDSLRALQGFATGECRPDLRILLDIPVERGLARRHGDGANVNRIDLAPTDFHEGVRAMFLQLAAENPSGWAVIDADQEIDLVASDIIAAVETHLQSERGFLAFGATEV